LINIAILGSTGSIGTQCTDIVDMNPDRFRIYALAAHSNVELFQKQLDKYKPRFAALFDERSAANLNVPLGCTLYTGAEGVSRLAELDRVDAVVVAIVGIAGLDATYKAVKCGKRVALANKEALVTGGSIIDRELKQANAFIYPVDSEHSAIFQCLNGEDRGSIRNIILTASGGAFRDYDADMLRSATPEDALKHPNWSMGKKITIDCATMMNKGLEVIEAHWLFGVPSENIKVVVHRESIVHSMVEFKDGAVVAQLGRPDMRLPILYALTHPERLETNIDRLDFTQVMSLSFSPPDKKLFPCLQLAYDALAVGEGMPTVLNAANEVAVQAFLNKKIGFYDISNCVEYAMEHIKDVAIYNIDDIHKLDKYVRRICFERFIF